MVSRLTGANCGSAPGLRQNEKLRSPLSSIVTNASVVCCVCVVQSPDTSTPAARKAVRAVRPNPSFPVMPINALFPPSFAAAAAQFAGAPPGFASKRFLPPALFPQGVKSIKISPSAVTSIFVFCISILSPGPKRTIPDTFLKVFTHADCSKKYFRPLPLGSP